MTFGEVFESAMKCDTLDQANSWMQHEVQRHVTEYNQTPEEAENIIKSNLGYFAGYYDEATREKIERLFSAQRPIFGSVSIKQ